MADPEYVLDHKNVQLEYNSTNCCLLHIFQEFRGGEEREDGGEIGVSGINFPMHLGETPTHSTEKQSKQPKAAQCL